MRQIVGVLRLTLMAIALILGTVVVLMAAFIPGRIQGARVCAWPVWALARIIASLLPIDIICSEQARLRSHQGFIFPNHLSYLDIIILLYLAPMRFLSNQEVGDAPFVGWIARALDTVFIKQHDQASRQQARQALNQIETFPPVVIFPEGGIFRPPETVKPLRYGAFEIAIGNGSPFMPCVFIYQPLLLAFFKGGHILAKVWQLATYPGRLRAELVVLDAVQPEPDADAKVLAEETREKMTAVLQNHTPSNEPNRDI